MTEVRSFCERVSSYSYHLQNHSEQVMTNWYLSRLVRTPAFEFSLNVCVSVAIIMLTSDNL